jgi:phosphocarrier protein FPr/phosphocarrier protein
MSAGDIVLNAPFGGWLTPLDEVPDPVFAERMMGDGVAIDPTSSTLCAPADGMIIAIPETAHAVTMRLDNGAEILIHIGLETVALGGAGFRSLSTAGASVKAGDPLIEVDLDRVARASKGLITPLILASEGYSLTLERPSRSVSPGDPIGTISGQPQAAEAAVTVKTHEQTVTIKAPHGVHARPAARISALLRPLAAEVSIVSGDRSASARSVVALLALGLRNGDKAQILGRGEDSEKAVMAVAGLIESGLGEPEAPVPEIARAPMGTPVRASPGLAIGRVVQFRPGDLPVPRDGAGVAVERERLASALERAASSLFEGTSVAAELAEAHRALLDDPDLIAHANRTIAEGRSAAFAWRSACEEAREAIRATGDALLVERAADLLDLERRVIGILLDDTSPAVPELPPAAILVAPDLLPTQFLAFDKSRLAGICTAEGGPTSHVAILAASAGVPMIVNAGPAVLETADGVVAIVDGDRGRIEIDPAPDRLSEVQRIISERNSEREAEASVASEPCFTADGVRIEVFANLGSLADAHAAVAAGAEGCGLLRTEFLFLDRDSAPSEEEQRQVYCAIAQTLDGRPLVVRTLDIGADKSVPYVVVGREDNPALGLRGIRLSFERPDLLATQFTAILVAMPAEQCRIMLPMIIDVEELRKARELLDRTRESLGFTGSVALGVMIETPAAAMLAESIAAEADFLSVGTNDLTQYALAADRGNAAVAPIVDALHPAVIRLIREAARGALAHGRWIGVCGGLASDPLAAAILIGLGVTELSVVPAAIPKVKATVRRLRIEDCRAFAERACTASSAQEVRAIAAETFQ